jgi:HAE1 family hydrophobic/amphiphilic exporter-1
MQLLNRDLFPEVHTAFVQVGTNREARTVSITLDVGEGHTRERTSAEIGRAAVAAGISVAPEMRARRGSGGGGGGNDQPVQVRVFGDDLTQLTAATNGAEAALRALPKLADVTNSLTAAPEITIRPDNRRLMDLGANTQQIGTAVRVAYQGAEVGKWAEANGKERDVRVVVPADVRNRPDAIADLPLFKRGPQLITLSQVATTTSELKPTKITRVNRQRVATLGAEPHDVPLGTAVEQVTATMDGLGLPPATHWELAGTSQDQVDSFS